jgi:preprotein translocase subunit Sss1
MNSERIREQFRLGEAFRYFFRVFRKPDPKHPSSINLRMMHGINRISIILFLICIIVMIVRAFTR